MKKLSNKDFNQLFKVLFFLPGFRKKNKTLASLALVYYLLPLFALSTGYKTLAGALGALPFVLSYGYGGWFKKIKKEKMVSILAGLVFLASLILTPTYAFSSFFTSLSSPDDMVSSIYHYLAYEEDYERVQVLRVVDGDTLEISRLGQKERVRLILVNTPETKHPTKGVQYYGKEASAFTKSQLENRMVYLEKDTSDRDQYGRLLRYVWLEKPSGPLPGDQELAQNCFNAILIKEGYGQVSSFPPDIKYQKSFQALEREARDQARGLWQNPAS
ncbi:MAG: thermonuclease family protein [Tissierellia bacterium]|nr:thermonuclease family protein [Tissierellia bacterium]